LNNLRLFVEIRNITSCNHHLIMNRLIYEQFENKHLSGIIDGISMRMNGVGKSNYMCFGHLCRHAVCIRWSEKVRLEPIFSSYSGANDFFNQLITSCFCSQTKKKARELISIRHSTFACTKINLINILTFFFTCIYI
jgi:hypothetical protein